MNSFAKFSSLAMVSALGLVLSLNASAQTSSSDIIEECEMLSGTPQEEIRCLRLEIRSLLNDEHDIQSPQLETLDSGGEVMVSEAKPDNKAANSLPIGLGAEQVIARSEPVVAEDPRPQSSVLSSKVVDHSSTADQRLVLVLENGNVWVQSKGDGQTISIREGMELTVSIRRGAISGYRVKLNELDRVIHAERYR